MQTRIASFKTKWEGEMERKFTLSSPTDEETGSERF
jgi:hypothetical protein